MCVDCLKGLCNLENTEGLSSLFRMNKKDIRCVVKRKQIGIFGLADALAHKRSWKERPRNTVSCGGSSLFDSVPSMTVWK